MQDVGGTPEDAGGFSHATPATHPRPARSMLTVLPPVVGRNRLSAMPSDIAASSARPKPLPPHFLNQPREAFDVRRPALQLVEVPRLAGTGFDIPRLVWFSLDGLTSWPIVGNRLLDVRSNTWNTDS